jgi:uncharacterized membrane protein YphA (DoxX/SURF4 family)
MNNLSSKKVLFWIGKIIVVGVFLYFGFESIFNPNMFSGLIPVFVGNILSPQMVVMLHGGVEVVCGLLILFSLGGVIPVIVLMFSMTAVIVVVGGTIQIRDIGILGSLFLLLSNYYYNKSENPKNI